MARGCARVARRPYNEEATMLLLRRGWIAAVLFGIAQLDDYVAGVGIYKKYPK